MLKLLVGLVTWIIVSSVANSQSVTENQQWECALDLHQGDTGTMSLNRSGNNIDGEIRVTRNELVLESNLDGRWIGNEIDLNRLLDSNSSEAMTGVVLALGTEKVKIGGRFSNDYHGVWSADCDLVAGSTVAQASEISSPEAVVPSTRSSLSPSNPTNRDRLTFSADATHAEGIEKITFFLGSDEIGVCETTECEVAHGPLPSGVYTWRVEVTSENGVSAETTNQFSIQNIDSQNNCQISGIATGASGGLAEIYLVKLYGPNDDQILRATSGFDNGRYQFSNLAVGEYKLIVDTRADQGVLATPANTILSCQSGSMLTQNIDFF